MKKAVPAARRRPYRQRDVPSISIGGLYRPELLRDDVDLPEVAEVDLVRHYTALSRRNFGVDIGFYPLGSCTMKYNPKINEDVARLPGFTASILWPRRRSRRATCGSCTSCGCILSEIFGMADFTLQPAAGAQGELTGVMMIKKYFEKKGRSAARSSSPTPPTEPTRLPARSAASRP